MCLASPNKTEDELEFSHTAPDHTKRPILLKSLQYADPSLLAPVSPLFVLQWPELFHQTMPHYGNPQFSTDPLPHRDRLA
jgi:hypothetical protein